MSFLILEVELHFKAELRFLNWKLDVGQGCPMSHLRARVRLQAINKTFFIWSFTLGPSLITHKNEKYGINYKKYNTPYHSALHLLNIL